VHIGEPRGILRDVGPPMDHERKRKFLIFIAMSYGCLALIGVQLWLRFDGYATASLIFGVVPLAGMTGTYWWSRRTNLFASKGQQ
jgi:hypothetical protein